MRGLFGLCRTGALCLFLLVIVPIAVSGFFVTALDEVSPNKFSQTVTVVSQPLAQTFALTAAMLCAMLLTRWLLERFAKVRLSALLCAVWLAAALFWVLGTGVFPRADSKEVFISAKQFAANDYAPLRGQYFHKYTYQLYMAFWFEMVARLLPQLDLNLTLQCMNAVLSVAAMGVTAALCEVFAGRRARYAAFALYLLFLPMMFFCTFVYDVQWMWLLCSGAFLCFALYVRDRHARYGIACAALMALAMTTKLNAAVPLLALLICMALDALSNRDARTLGIAALCAALSLALPSAIVAQYELRGGVTMRPDISMVSRLAMGIQDSPIAPGWYNCYTELFFGPEVTIEEEKEIATADLVARLEEMAEDPGQTFLFFRDKCLSQWIEPSYEIFWHQNVTVRDGRFNGLSNAVIRDGEPVHETLLAYMGAFQRMMYLLASVGAIRTLRRGANAAQLMLPVTVLGGFLYHMLFEAKAQYIFVYALYLIPMAAQGLCAVDEALARVRKKN